jgi:hypothetical protein
VTTPDLPERMRALTRDLNALVYERGAYVGRLEFDDIVARARELGLYAWLVADDVVDTRDGGYRRVFRVSPVPEAEDGGHGAIVVESGLEPRLLPMFNLYRHDDVAQAEGVAELRERFPTPGGDLG